MKKRHYISLAILLVGGLISAAVLGRPRQLPLEECSPEYLRYKDAPGIKASFVKDFPVNDTLALNVILLQATDSLGWETLKTDFNVKPTPQPVQEAIDRGEDIVALGLTPKGLHGQSMDTSDILLNNVMAISRLHHTISIVEIHSQQEIYAVCESKYQQQKK